MGVFQLIYQSVVSPHIQSEDIKRILESSLRNNQTNQISGILVKFRSEFFQILEGNEADVRALFKSIQKDTRHSSVQQVSSSYRRERQFPNWSMAFYNLKSEELDIIGKTKSIDVGYILSRYTDALGPVAFAQELQANFEPTF